jgi:hypothetical protein
MRRVACIVLAAFLFACGAANDLEVIQGVPAHVLTVDELSSRVQRSQYEAGTQLSGLRIVGVIVRRPAPCNPERGPWTCPKGVDARFLLADPGGEPIAMEVLGEGHKLEEGKRYVFWGAAELAPDVPQRWVLRARVLARVEAPGEAAESQGLQQLPEPWRQQQQWQPQQPQQPQPQQPWQPQPQPAQPQPQQPWQPQPQPQQPWPQQAQPQPQQPQPQQPWPQQPWPQQPPPQPQQQ